jgi:type I restriction enzyme S subunit
VSVSLRKIIKVHYGKSLRSDERDDTGQFPVYGSSGEIGKHNAAFIEQPTIIIGRKGSVGAVTYAPTGGWAIDTTFYTEIINPNEVDLRYLYYALKTSNLARHTITTSIPGLNRDDIYRTSIFLPLIDEQRRIAAILDKADALREKRRQAINKLDTLLQGVFLDMFGNPIKNPKGWEIKLLGDLGEGKDAIVDGPFGSAINVAEDYADQGDVPIIRTKNVSPFRFVTEDLKFISNEKFETVKRSQVLPNDIVLTKVGTIGNVCIFPPLFERAVLSTTGSCRIRPDQKLVNTEYLAFFLHLYKPEMLKLAAQGVQAFLNMRHIKSFRVPLPPLERQEAFASKVDKIRKLKNRFDQSARKLEGLFYSIQQRAFDGELFNGKATAATLPRKTVTTSQPELFD